MNSKKHASALAAAYIKVGELHMERALEHCHNGDPMQTFFEVTKYRAASNQVRQLCNRESITQDDLREYEE